MILRERKGRKDNAEAIVMLQMKVTAMALIVAYYSISVLTLTDLSNISL